MAVTGGAQQVNQAFRQTAAGVQLGRQLFDPDMQLDLSPQTISGLLRAAGVPIPQSVLISQQVGQIIMSGGAIVDDIELGADIAAMAVPSVNILHDALNIFEISGLLPKNSPAAQIMTLGVDAALVIACGGLNILADLTFVLDIVMDIIDANARIQRFNDHAIAVAQNQAIQQDYNDFRQWFAQKTGAEAKTAATLFSSYQSGQIDVFEMMGGVAEQSPDLFNNYFPDAKAFFPPITMQSPQFTNQVRALLQLPIGGAMIDAMMQLSHGTYGLVSETRSFQYQSIDATPDKVQHGLFDYFYTYPIKPYERLASLNEIELRNLGFPKGVEKLGITSHDHPVRRMTVHDLAVLSMFPPYFKTMSPNLDISTILYSLGLTPHDFDNSLIEDEMSLGRDFGNKPVPRQAPPFTMNGVDYFTGGEIAYNHSRDVYDLQTKRAVQYDLASDAANLFRIQRVNKIVKEWGVLPELPNDVALGAIGFHNVVNQPGGYRDMRNLWAAYAMYNKMEKSKFFQGFQMPGPGILGHYTQLQEQHKRLQFLSAGRKLNKKARSNVASFFGIPVSKLKMAPLQKGQLARVI